MCRYESMDNPVVLSNNLSLQSVLRVTEHISELYTIKHNMYLFLHQQGDAVAVTILNRVAQDLTSLCP
jgi:GTP cyclohydrolase III